MAFTLWLSADEERILERIMRAEGARNKQQAVIQALWDKDAMLLPSGKWRETPAVLPFPPRRLVIGLGLSPSAAREAHRRTRRGPHICNCPSEPGRRHLAAG